MNGSVAREDMADESDRASALERLEIDQRLRLQQKSMVRHQEPAEDGSYRILDCTMCGNEIGSERIRVAIKNTWCIECATLAERR